jgi:hypothetical protein
MVITTLLRAGIRVTIAGLETEVNLTQCAGILARFKTGSVLNLIRGNIFPKVDTLSANCV